jgi:hypothetical protein
MPIRSDQFLNRLEGGNARRESQVNRAVEDWRSRHRLEEGPGMLDEVPLFFRPWIEFTYGSRKKADGTIVSTDTWAVNHHARVRWVYHKGSMTATEAESYVTLPAPPTGSPPSGGSSFIDTYMRIKRPGLVRVDMQMAAIFSAPVGWDYERSVDFTATVQYAGLHNHASAVGDDGYHTHDVTYRFYDADKDWQWALIRGYSTTISGADDVRVPLFGRQFPDKSYDAACSSAAGTGPNTTQQGSAGTACEWHPPAPSNSCFGLLCVGESGGNFFTEFWEAGIVLRTGGPYKCAWSNVEIIAERTRLRLEWVEGAVE